MELGVGGWPIGALGAVIHAGGWQPLRAWCCRRRRAEVRTGEGRGGARRSAVCFLGPPGPDICQTRGRAMTRDLACAPRGAQTPGGEGVESGEEEKRGAGAAPRPGCP